MTCRVSPVVTIIIIIIYPNIYNTMSYYYYYTSAACRRAHTSAAIDVRTYDGFISVLYVQTKFTSVQIIRSIKMYRTIILNCRRLLQYYGLIINLAATVDPSLEPSAIILLYPHGYHNINIIIIILQKPTPRVILYSNIYSTTQLQVKT